VGIGWIIGLIFLGVFAVVALLFMAGGSGAFQKAKQVHATLDSALATDSPEERSQLGNLRKIEQFSSIPWINSKLRNIELVPRLQALLNQADVHWNAGSLLSGCGVCFLVGAILVYWRLGIFYAAVGAGVLLGLAPLGWVFHKRTKRLDKFQEGLPEALDLMVSALRAGHSLIAAMGTVARECADPVGCEFKICFEEQNFGLAMKIALDNLINRVPLQDLRIFATAIIIQRESGGNLAEVLDKTSHIIRERFRLKRQVSVHTAQGRMTGWVLSALPVALGCLLYFINPKLMSALWTDPFGRKLLGGAVCLLLIGGYIINRIVNMDV
jgi:tight adherence protein B